MTPSGPAAARAEYEAHADRWLAACAVREADCGGRGVDEPPHAYRTCFQRDRDRIVHCSAFRRLDFKTQVFVPHQGDHFRTRLTHTLEVAQIARTLARPLRLNEDLAEAVALAHDLGHSPFGHGGETELNELMADHGGFEHNRQSLRVVDYLEHPYPGFRGLNLTRAVRECIALHRTRYDAPAAGEFDPSLWPPLEGQLVDLADEIAYTSADLEDALAAKWITTQQLVDLDLWQQAWCAAVRSAPDARDIHKRIRACKAVLNIMADDLLEQTSRNISDARLGSPDDARGAGRRTVAFSDELAAHIAGMQDFLLAEVYHDPHIVDRQRDSSRLIRDLFGALTADPGGLPDRYSKRIGADGLHQVVCDYIAGMTDRFCRVEHERICG